MKVFIRTHRLLPLATFVLLAALVAVTLVSPLVQVQWGGTNGIRLTLGGLEGHALASGTWTSQTSGTTNSLNGIACPSASNCFAVGATGTIVATTNGGSTSWTSKTSSTTNSLNGIACPDTTTCFAVGAANGGSAGTILNTTTSGSTWSSQNGKVKQNYNGVACLNTTTCYVVGAGGTILFANDGGGTGQSWTQLTSGTTNSLNGIACLNTTTCYVVGAGGTILKTINGSTWTSQTVGTANLNSIACPSTNNCFVVGASGTILNTTDGSSWTSQTSGTPNSLNGIACPSASSCFTVGNSGTILNNAGSLSESATTTSATSVTLNGVNHTTTYSLVATVSDTTGSGAGWNLMITSTTFTAGSHTLSTNASTINTAPTPTCVGSCTLPTVTGISYPFTIPAGTTAQKYFNAASGTGKGTMTITATVNVAIPANTIAGNYMSTLTIAISSGP